MSLPWTKSERSRVARAIDMHPVASGRCAALARAIDAEAAKRAWPRRGLQIRPRGAARFVVPRVPNPPLWYSHTLVEAYAHVVDALTGADGTVSADYLATHFEYAATLLTEEVDLADIDPGIEDTDE